MPIRVAVAKENTPGELRVAVVPAVADRLATLGVEILLEAGAGQRAHFEDGAYTKARLVTDARALYSEAQVVLKVLPPSDEEIEWLAEGTVVIGFMMPHRYPERVARMRDRGITSFAMELIPRISRAQSMDALSSQAAAAGYKAALIAAGLTGRFFPMLTTAAGTIRPAKVLVIGAGVAGLQAIATSRRLGAIVEAYDVRGVTKEQVQSLGAKFVDVGVDAQTEGGYARELTEAEKQQSAEVLGRHVSTADVVITTAAVPGRTAPRIITRAMTENMKPGAVIVDLAAESGGNCELTRPGETVEHAGVLIHGPLNVPSMLAADASEMYSKNILNLLSLMIKDGELVPDWDDEVIAGSALTHNGVIRHEPTRALVEGDN
ncbi:MAG: NAD(P) transhydrogenase subunit alpha [Chromatiales bacterium 21-64-14]|nr:MAG: NAD(P) transhydrogenase subunit alpha [Chromatiales bacterium 21-64-14]HQU16139.1 Re/Si-specific NAD(P)(+) transhydrogenase subunit alpha [Gammaproteobacteria bacterium]